MKSLYYVIIEWRLPTL